MAAALLFSNVALAATFTVNTTTDAHDASPGDGSCRTAAGECSLRAAIEEANTLTGAHAIDVAPGAYPLVLGALVVDRAGADVTIEATGAARTTNIDAEGTSGIFALQAGKTTLRNLGILRGGIRITDRAAYGQCSGAGIFVGSAATATIVASAIDGNSADNGGGAGLCISGTVTLVETTVRNNVASYGGAGMRITATGSVLLVDSAVHDNRIVLYDAQADTSGLGGVGIDAQGTISIINSTISGNFSQRLPGVHANGSALAVRTGGSAVVQNSTIAYNGDDSQVHVEAGGHATFVSTLIASYAVAANCSSTAGIASLGHNLDNYSQCGFNDATDLGAGAGPVLIAELADNGGPTMTHALLAESAGIDKGANPLALATDQRGAGFARVVGDSIDIGAFETAATAPSAPAFLKGPPADGSVNVDYLFRYATSGLPVPNLYVSSGTLPPGLVFVQGSLYGAPATAGTYAGVVTASNASGQASQPFSITIHSEPIVTSTTVIPAIEYYHAGFNHYFITANPEEIAKLDAGVIAGWSRTGQSFLVFAQPTASDGAVCRFFSTAFAPKSSHFYTASASECATVQHNPNWLFEGVVFGVTLPDTSPDRCPVPSLRVFRLYNNGQGGAPNHRYTTDPGTWAQMVAQGWIGEGDDYLGVSMCAP